MNDRRTVLKRIAAMAGVLFFVCVIISLCISLAKNAAPGTILAHLFCLIVVPCILYMIMFVRKLLSGRKK